MNKTSTTKKILLGTLLIIALILIVGTGYFIFTYSGLVKKAQLQDTIQSSVVIDTNINKLNEEEAFAKFLDSISTVNDSLTKQLSGKLITISICGIDTRINCTIPHADANHLLKVWLDSGVVEVVSIPRGTFTKAGFNDTTGLNYLANLRSNKGREAYLEAVAKIAGVEKVDFYVEFGFSQAIALLELFGFKDNAPQMLRVLRSRISFGIGDYQRAYNQGQFIRQMILKHVSKLDGIYGEIIIRAMLMIVDTDLSYKDIDQIYSALKTKSFPKNENSVVTNLHPSYRYDVQDFNFSEKNSTDSIYKFVAKRSNYSDSVITDKKTYDNSKINKRVTRQLTKLINQAKNDIEKRPNSVINTLSRVYKQRAWYQISDKKEREEIRNNICDMLISAYSKLNYKDEAKEVRDYLLFERRFNEIKK